MPDPDKPGMKPGWRWMLEAAAVEDGHTVRVDRLSIVLALEELDRLTRPPVTPQGETERRIPPEVSVDYQGNQILALNERGESFARYLPCAGGCGYLVGVGDAIDQAWHESCAAPPVTPQGDAWYDVLRDRGVSVMAELEAAEMALFHVRTAIALLREGLDAA